MRPDTLKPKAPPIKTQGIKTRLVPFIASHIEWDWQGRWVEPFLGSGAVLLNIRPPRALVADSCVPIINFYRGLQRGRLTAAGVESFLRFEGERLRTDGADRYYQIRDRFNDKGDPLDFLFLSRACFNGLMRFNRRGHFNTPFCKKRERFSRAYITKICNQVQWAIDAMRGREWEFACVDWRDVLSEVNERDFIYADPPYSGRYTDYYNAWNDIDAFHLAQVLKQAPCRFLYSMWVENRYRRNESLFDWFADYKIATFEHFYHLGATESLRHSMQEGLVVG
jgi:DNA adenine methylase